MNLKNFTVGLLLLAVVSCVQEDNQGMVSKNSKTKALLSESSPTSFEDAFTTVDQFPLFGGCTDMSCSNTQLISFVQKHLVYPADAKNEGVEGTVYVQFVVETDGSVSNIIAKNDPGHLGEAAIAMIEKMNGDEVSWAAGVHQDKKVPVMLTLPVTYKI